MRLHIFQHEETCGPGALLDWIKARGVEAHWSRFYLGESVPEFEDVEALLILGGSMNAYQDADYPHLKAVRDFTQRALGANKRVFGICLGAQIMADALGSPVVKAAQREMGWTQIRRCPQAAQSPLLSWLPERHEFLSWHGDTFALPQGAVHGAKSEVCASQAFAWGEHALAVQFHPESDASIVARWIEDEPVEDGERLRGEFLVEEKFEAQKRLLFVALDGWASS